MQMEPAVVCCMLHSQVMAIGLEKGAYQTGSISSQLAAAAAATTTAAAAAAGRVVVDGCRLRHSGMLQPAADYIAGLTMINLVPLLELCASCVNALGFCSALEWTSSRDLCTSALPEFCFMHYALDWLLLLTYVICIYVLFNEAIVNRGAQLSVHHHKIARMHNKLINTTHHAHSLMHLRYSPTRTYKIWSNKRSATLIVPQPQAEL